MSIEFEVTHGHNLLMGECVGVQLVHNGEKWKDGNGQEFLDPSPFLLSLRIWLAKRSLRKKYKAYKKLGLTNDNDS